MSECSDGAPSPSSLPSRPAGISRTIEVDSECNRGLNVILQLLTKDADKFVYAAGLLADMGYREVNLNLGCPSGTVFNKGRGSGFLRDPEAIDAFAYASARTRAW